MSAWQHILKKVNNKMQIHNLYCSKDKFKLLYFHCTTYTHKEKYKHSLLSIIQNNNNLNAEWLREILNNNEIMIMKNYKVHWNLYFYSIIRQNLSKF